jgi:hypothetical protein
MRNSAEVKIKYTEPSIMKSQASAIAKDVEFEVNKCLSEIEP